MLAIESLSSRIDDEFAVLERKFKDTHVDALREWRERRQRIQQLDKVFETLGEAWKSRLAMLLKKFGDRVQVTPRLTPSSREAAFEFQSKLARVRLRFSATTDRDVRRVIVGYHLEIVPAFFRYQPHAELEFPLGAVDEAAAARWVDDRIVEFVRAYLMMAESEFDAQEHMVEDPVAHVRFPDFAAGATLDWQGKTYYFVGEETRQEFARELESAVTTRPDILEGR
jgi:YHS domain-containing protein